MKALGEQGLDVLVEEIKKRTDGLDGKNGSVVDELDEVLKFAYNTFTQKVPRGIIGWGDNPYFVIADKYCNTLAEKLACNYIGISYDMYIEYRYNSCDEMIEDVHEHLRKNAPDGPIYIGPGASSGPSDNGGLFWFATATDVVNPVYFSIFDI